MNPCKCGGEVHLDYQQGDYTGQYWYAICNDCGAEYPLKSNNRIDAEREWNNRKEGNIMNLIPKIAEMLGVEVGEEFNLINTETKTSNITERTPTKYRLNNDCPTIIEYYIPAGDRWSRSTALFNILNGNLEIVKLPFEPKKGEKYFVVSVVDKTVWPYTWEETTADYCFKACGNCFRTEAEAKKHKYEIYEKLTGRKWEEKDG